jgi:two-component system response regulator VicR
VEALRSDDSFDLLELSLKTTITNFEHVDALIIHSDSEKDIGKICELLMVIRKQSSVMIWIFSDKLPKSTRLILLQLGADGILNSQVELEEYMLMLKNALQYGVTDRGRYLSEEVEKNDFKLIPSNLSVKVNDDSEIALTRLEFRTIDLLYKQKSEAVSYETIYQQVWNNDTDPENLKFRVANLVFHLRRKIEKDPLKPEYIKTIRSLGYMLNV